MWIPHCEGRQLPARWRSSGGEAAFETGFGIKENSGKPKKKTMLNNSKTHCHTGRGADLE